jgi:hypothetical protein
MAQDKFCVGGNGTCERLVVEENETKCSQHRGELHEMVAALRKYGMNHGFSRLEFSTAVVVVGPGAPFNVYPTSYSSSDLQRAIETGLLKKRKLSGFFDLEFYATS